MRLPSGKIVEANAGIIGLDDELMVFGGYDDTFKCESDPPLDYDDGRDPGLSKREAVELADLMIGRWQAFRAKNLP